MMMSGWHRATTGKEVSMEMVVEGGREALERDGRPGELFIPLEKVAMGGWQVPVEEAADTARTSGQDHWSGIRYPSLTCQTPVSKYGLSSMCTSHHIRHDFLFPVLSKL